MCEVVNEQALLADKKAQELGTEHYDYNFYIGKVMSARYYVLNVLPNIMNVAIILENEDDSVLNIPVEAFNY